ncbi:hypothetical protein E8K88_02655 [Lampropedia aestuarii]|uniref:Uncharacterized protein n=1 Tax=Lampropedia aestuarii TaxID=2562762 RepID=A0A4S5BXL8_9BURK|nr:hypothetical protein [Lampropedia aestuarii]THJ36183.1 hypothetical protein E8K88_02655 [Lampropedia aestuarii]
MGKNQSDTSPQKPVADWERIELDYRAGIKSLREIAEGSGVSHVTISKRAKRDGWTRDLASKIQAKADELVNKALVNNSVNSASPVNERKTVEDVGQLIATVKLSHQADIRRTRKIVNALFDELEQQTDPETVALMQDLGDLMRTPDERGMDRMNDLYQKIISLPERSKTAKVLGETLRIAIDLERQAFNMDAKEQAQPGQPGFVPLSVAVAFVDPPKRPAEDDDE